MKNVNMEISRDKLPRLIFIFLILILFLRVTPVLAKSESQTELWEKGNSYCLQAKWRSAIATFDKLLKKYPNTTYVEAYFWIGYSYIQIGKYQEGISRLYNFARKYPSNNYTPQALFKIGETYETKLKKYDRAMSAYGDVAKRYPGSAVSVPAAQNQALILQQRKKDYKSAEKVLAKSKQIAANQGLSTGNIYIGRANRRMKFIRENSDYNYKPLSLFMDGISLEEDRRWNEAAGVYSIILKKYPGANIVDDALYRRIRCLVRMKKYSKAKKEAKSFLKDYPSSKYKNNVQWILKEAVKKSEFLQRRLRLYFV
ncbi:MAG: tetratricopeptide repeat protein [Candidatus Eremiobacteraeota bacterium]|nr:tetratricopeptide repeat protein [Candidatus Eremiobacteraeota bacterium]